MKGGEADAVRLLSLAEKEIAAEILPGLSADARYRMRLVLNALKIAGAELRDGGDLNTITLAQLQTVETAPQGDGAETLGAMKLRLQVLLRQGEFDGNQALHRALVIIAEERGRLIR